jgi:ribosomal 50S subunit-recycling heat shock protein
MVIFALVGLSFGAGRVEAQDSKPAAAATQPVANHLQLLLKPQSLSSAVFSCPDCEDDAPKPGRVALLSTAAPTTQPIDPTIKTLIEQLGDDSPRVRAAAAASLRKLGKDALPGLKGATQNEDPQIRTSAESLVAEMTEPRRVQPTTAQAQANAGPGLIVLNGGGLILNNVRFGQGNFQGQMQMQVHVVANGQATRDISVNENGRKVHIHEDNDGVKVEVTSNGETKEYAAKNSAELKEKQPEGFKEYERYMNNGAGRLRIQVAPN